MVDYNKKQEVSDPDQTHVPLIGISFDGKILHDKRHQHRRAQLLYCTAGSYELRVADSLFLVPPTHAIWIPGGMDHQGYAANRVNYRSLYFATDYFTTLPKHMHVITVSKLLKSLIEKACLFSIDYAENSAELRLAAVIVDEINLAQTQTYFLPLTDNAQLQAIQKYLEEHLSENLTSDEIAAKFNMSSKTMTRLCKKETGHSFAQWRQQFKLLKAIELLCLDNSTTMVAQTLGYSNDSAFIYRFKRLMGRTPSGFKQGVKED